MKNKVCAIVAIVLILSAMGTALNSCTEVVVTAKYAELKEQYPFYEMSVRQIQEEMELTPEQADEVFIIMAACGLDEEIQSIYRKHDEDNVFSYYWKGSSGTYDIKLNDNCVSMIEYYSQILYPFETDEIFEYDQLQKLYLQLNSSMSYDEALNLIIESGLSYDVGYNTYRERTITVAYNPIYTIRDNPDDSNPDLLNIVFVKDSEDETPLTSDVYGYCVYSRKRYNEKEKSVTYDLIEYYSGHCWMFSKKDPGLYIDKTEILTTDQNFLKDTKEDQLNFLLRLLPNEEKDIAEPTTAPPTTAAAPTTSPPKTEPPPATAEPTAAPATDSGKSGENNFDKYDIPEQQNTTSYVLNTSTKKFHESSCADVKKIKPENHSTIESRATAVSWGYDPCKKCNP